MTQRPKSGRLPTKKIPSSIQNFLMPNSFMEWPFILSISTFAKNKTETPTLQKIHLQQNRWRWCWWLIVGNDLWMSVTEFRCWWQLLNVSARHVDIGDQNGHNCQWQSVTNILSLSPTDFVSNIRHQRRCNRHKLVFKFLVWAFWLEK